MAPSNVQSPAAGQVQIPSPDPFLDRSSHPTKTRTPEGCQQVRSFREEWVEMLEKAHPNRLLRLVQVRQSDGGHDGREWASDRTRFAYTPSSFCPLGLPSCVRKPGKRRS